MKKTGLILMLVALFACGATAQTWTPLFNGKNLKGWKQLNGKATYKVENGAIVGIAVPNTPNSFLATEKLYTDFILEMEVKLENPTNSGIQFRSNSLKEYNDGRVHGYQYEIDPSERAWSGGVYDEARRGWLYSLENNTAAKPAFKFNAWNKVRIEAIGNSIRTWLNGIPCADILDDMTSKGFIALQVHSIRDPKMAGSRILWKDIKICTTGLDAAKTPYTSTITQLNYIDNTVSEREVEAGWKLLFDGKTMDQWVSPRSNQFPSKGFSIEGGELIVNKEGNKGGGDIMTKKRYKDFEMTFDFFLTEGANNGIKYNYQVGDVAKEDQYKGPEFQLLDNERHPDAKQGLIPRSRQLGAYYDNMPPIETTKIFKGVNKWNTGKIISKGAIVQHWLNGVKVLEYDRSSYAFDVFKSLSKFNKCEKFGQFEDGHLLITDHSDMVKFKNLKVREL